MGGVESDDSANQSAIPAPEEAIVGIVCGIVACVHHSRNLAQNYAPTQNSALALSGRDVTRPPVGAATVAKF